MTWASQSAVPRSGRPLLGLADALPFAADGRPITAARAGDHGCLDISGCDRIGFWSPGVLDGGHAVWNVFPMRRVEGVSVPLAASTAGLIADTTL